MTDRYTVPALGGIEVEDLTPDRPFPLPDVCYASDKVPVTHVLIPGVGPAFLPTAALTPATPPLAEEPPVGAGRIDRHDIIWQRLSFPDASWCSTTGGYRLDWAELNRRNGPLRTVVVVEPVDLPYETRDMDGDVAFVEVRRRGKHSVLALRGGDAYFTPDEARRYCLAGLAAADQAEAENERAEPTKRTP